MQKSYVHVNGIFCYVRMHDLLSSCKAGHSSATVTAANVTRLCKVAVTLQQHFCLLRFIRGKHGYMFRPLRPLKYIKLQSQLLVTCVWPIPVAAQFKALACWDYGFEFRRGHGCPSHISVMCCEGSILRPQESYRVWCV